MALPATDLTLRAQIEKNYCEFNKRIYRTDYLGRLRLNISDIEKLVAPDPAHGKDYYLAPSQYCVSEVVEGTTATRYFHVIPDPEIVVPLADYVRGNYPPAAAAVADGLLETIRPEMEREEAVQSGRSMLWELGLMQFPLYYVIFRQTGLTNFIDAYLDRGLNPPVDLVKDMGAKFKAGKTFPAVGYEADFQSLRDKIHEPIPRVIIITAPGGDEKTYFGENGLAYEVFSGRYLQDGIDPNNTKMFSVSLKALEGHSDSNFLGQFTARWDDVAAHVDKSLKQGKFVILTIDEIQRLKNGMGATEGYTYEDSGKDSIWMKIEEWLKNPRMLLLAMTTDAKYEQMMLCSDGSKDRSLERRFDRLRLSILPPEARRRDIELSYFEGISAGLEAELRKNFRSWDGLAPGVKDGYRSRLATLWEEGTPAMRWAYRDGKGVDVARLARDFHRIVVDGRRTLAERAPTDVEKRQDAKRLEREMKQFRGGVV